MSYFNRPRSEKSFESSLILLVENGSSFESWWTIRFSNANNNLEDIVLTNIGEGFYPANTQIGTLDTIKARKTSSIPSFLARLFILAS